MRRRCRAPWQCRPRGLDAPEGGTWFRKPAVILSRGRRYIFVHIPKTGGTALALALESRAMKDDILIGDTPKARARKHRWKGAQSHGRLWKHSTLSDITGLATEAEIDSFFTFTLVRNPWDRVVSYYHWLQAQAYDHPSVTLAKSRDFSGFLNHSHTRNAFRFWPARAYMTTRQGVERASLFLRLEHLPDDLPMLEAHLGFRLGPLARANSSRRDRDWRVYYSDADAALLADLCAEDVARFGYRFDPA